MLSYFIIGVIIIIPCIGLILIAMALGTDYRSKDEKEYWKYKELDDNDEPLVIHGQGDYRKVIRPSNM